MHSIVDTWQKQTFLTSAQKSLEREQLKNKQLHQQLNRVSQAQFVEEQARDKLLLVKPGEELVLLPSIQSNQTEQSSTKLENTNKPHWQEWWDIFFGKPQE